MEPNEIIIEFISVSAAPLPPEIIRSGHSQIVMDHYWAIKTVAGEFGVWQFPNSDCCSLAVGHQSFLIPMTAPVLAASAMALMLAVGFLLVVGAKLFKQAKRT